jgi:PhnB protein
MANFKLDPYIFFNGNCREAMEFYKGIFGGELTTSSYDDLPGDPPEGLAGKLMHSRLEGPVRILASDTTKADVHGHGKIHLSLSGADEAKLRPIFDQLSAGGKVNSPLKKESWGDLYGSLVDKFGVNWMVNIGTSMDSKSG